MEVSRGGENSVENLNPMCRTCNRRKGNKTLEEFFNWLSGKGGGQPPGGLGGPGQVLI
jgi:5-methylcytosine-specific restriction endonuclease McrA